MSWGGLAFLAAARLAAAVRNQRAPHPAPTAGKGAGMGATQAGIRHLLAEKSGTAVLSTHTHAHAHARKHTRIHTPHTQYAGKRTAHCANHLQLVRGRGREQAQELPGLEKGLGPQRTPPHRRMGAGFS
jgi:hypothetical protein